MHTASHPARSHGLPIAKGLTVVFIMMSIIHTLSMLSAGEGVEVNGTGSSWLTLPHDLQTLLVSIRYQRGDAQTPPKATKMEQQESLNDHSGNELPCPSRKTAGLRTEIQRRDGSLERCTRAHQFDLMERRR